MNVTAPSAGFSLAHNQEFFYCMFSNFIQHIVEGNHFLNMAKVDTSVYFALLTQITDRGLIWSVCLNLSG